MYKHEILKRYFGYDSFRTGQEALVDALLGGRNVLGIMPTGAGKSLCYQIPALMMSGITLVISPLISLMKDQVNALVQQGVSAAYLNRSLTESQYAKALKNAANGRYKIIYVAPERLESVSFMNMCRWKSMVRTPLLARMTAAVSSIALLLTLAACSTPQPSSSDSGDGVKQSDAGSVTLFAPSDGITMSQKTPLNKWAKLVPQITSDLEHQGMAKKSIDTHVANGLDEQSQQLQDWVVEHVTSVKNKEEMKRGTLIVAPASQTNISSRQYGDYVSQTAVAKVAQSSEQQEAEGRMRSALQLAKKAGMHVVLVSNTIEGFTPDAFVRCSTPEQIGELQANMLVNKLDLNKVGKGNPKAIEVLLPYTNAEDASETIENTEIDDAFAKEAFKGVWKILKPYYEQGKLYSPSGTLSKESTDEDWKEVAFDLNEKDGVAKTMESRIPLSKKDGVSVLTKIDGVIAMNDAVASSVVDKLADM